MTDSSGDPAANGATGGWLMSASIFFLFSPFGLLIAMCQPRPWGLFMGIVSAAFSGVLAVGWSHALGLGRRWLIPVLVLGPVTSPWWLWIPLSKLDLYGLWSPGGDVAGRVVLSVVATALTATGYALLVRYIRGRERSSARAWAELDVARRMHESIVPTITHRAGTVEALGVSVASGEMGGDLIDLVERDGVIDAMIADVSGHGVGAGLVMGMVKGAVRTRLMAGGGLGDVARDVNAVLCRVTRPETFVTGAFLRVHPGGRVEYTLAGHLPIYWRRGDGRVESLENASLPLAVMEDESFASRAVSAGPGDLFVVFTDGLMEVTNEKSEQLGLAPLEAVISERGAGSLAELKDALLARAHGHGPANDDQSLLLLRV